MTRIYTPTLNAGSSVSEDDSESGWAMNAERMRNLCNLGNSLIKIKFRCPLFRYVKSIEKKKIPLSPPHFQDNCKKDFKHTPLH